MHVDLALLGLFFSAVSTVVVVVGALAAVRQLRYLRQGNELETLEGLYREWVSDTMRSDREFVMHDVPVLLGDPAFAAELEELPVGPRAQRIVRVVGMLERVAAYEHAGALSEEFTTMLWANAAADHWNTLRPAIARLRAVRGMRLYEHTEDFVMRVPELLHRYERRTRKLRRDPAIDAAPGVPYGRT